MEGNEPTRMLIATRVSQASGDSTSESQERIISVPATVTMANGIDAPFLPVDDDDEQDEEYSLASYSFDGSSGVSSSALTSSLSSYELPSGAKISGVTAQEQETNSPLSSNDDLMANLMGGLMQNRGIELSHALAERVSCIDSIKWLGHHLPESVVAFLIDEIEIEEAARELSASYEPGDFEESRSQLMNGDYPHYDPQYSEYHHNDDGENSDKTFDENSNEGYHTPQHRCHEGSQESLHQSSNQYDDSKMNRSGVNGIPESGHDQTDDLCNGEFQAAIYRSDREEIHGEEGYDADQYKNHDILNIDARYNVCGEYSYVEGYNDSADFDGGMKCNSRYDTGFRPYSDENDSDNDARSLQGPLHNGQNEEVVEKPRQLRRHSVIGMQTSSNVTNPEDMVTQVFGRQGEEAVSKPRFERRSSMPLVVRSMSTTGSNSRVTSLRRSPIPYSASDSSSGGSTSSLQFHKQNNTRKQTRRMRRRGSLSSSGSISSILYDAKTFGFDGSGPLRSDSKLYLDPFPYDSDEEVEKKDQMRQDRVMKTRDSIIKLSGGFKIDDLEDEYGSLNEGSEADGENMYFTEAIPPATRHDCALLFVDISGFTKLSTTLPVEPLSKMIVDEVEAFGGDVLKFAGDAVFCEWQATTSNPLDAGDGISLGGSSQGSIEPWHGLGLEECVLTAAACGARIVDKCSDHPVFEGGGSSGTQVATLNVHCGVGFGEVVGVHVGDRETRMEYLILGDPIGQVADAILVANRGEVVASPEALLMLEETAVLDNCILDADMDKPQVIATKSTCFFHPKGTDHIQQDWTVTLQDFTTKPRERLAKRCDDWDLPALTRLRQRMALYVHPVVVNDEFAMKIYPGDRNRAQERHRSEAELRDVYTIFLMPLITARLTGDDTEDCRVLVLLNDIMLIMTRELRRFKGHLRQFIVDDKGVVLIANFGLRGSTFPNMVAERAIPFTTAVQTLLKVELNTECQIGATYDKAYCGVVGGVTRHEYAVLGPSVNLAARLMGNPSNNGCLVDVSVKEKAGSRQFKALTPVKAKGYKNLVPIFEPILTADPKWNDLAGQFVGRDTELEAITEMAEELVRKGGPAKLLLVSAESGAGKSALCRQASKEIKTKCVARGIPHLSICTVCNEGDVFIPFSITRPLFMEVLTYLHNVENPDSPPRDPNEIVNAEEVLMLINGDLPEAEAPQSLLHFVQICEMVDMPDQFIEILGKLVLTHNRADVVDDPDNPMQTYMLSTIVQFVVKAFLNCTVTFDLIVLALDDVTNMDEMSWRIVELLYGHAQNMLIIGTTRPLEKDEDLKINLEFWERLNTEGLESGNFKQIKLAPMEKSEVDQLIANSLGQKECEVDPKMSHEVYEQSKGMPNLASEILAKLVSEEKAPERREPSDHETGRTGPVSGIDVGNIGEIVLHRMDALPSSVRTHLNLGAILGSVFELMDVIAVFEQYRGVQKEERMSHAKSVHESLEEAVRKGILEVTNKESSIHARYNASDHPYAANSAIYKFTHDVWRSNILRLTLDEWKKDMHSLIAQSMETVMDSQLANDYRVLTRLFSHWKESGSAKKAATLALKMGRSLEDIGLTHQSLIVYRESLDMWKAMDNSNEVPDEAIGGLSTNLLAKLESSDVEHLIRLNVALGRCYTNILDPKEAIRAFQTALNFIHKAPSSVLLEDRSIIFPVFSGLFIALRFGHNEDLQYEQGLVNMFLRETKLFNDPVHYSRALAMQAEMMVRHGKIRSALETSRDLRIMYNVEEHSNLISKAYGSDRSGQCIAQSALWNEHLNNHEEALIICDIVIKELLPRMDPQNVYNSFHMLYPVLWVMKKHGRALEARAAFDEFVVQNFMTRLDDRGLTSDRPLHTPIMALLDMAGSQCKTNRLVEYAEWALIEKNGLFGSELNFIMGCAGRTADSITAEMCLLLAHHTTDRVERVFFIRKGYEVARDAIALTRMKEDSHGMVLAYAQVKPIFDALEEMHSHLPPDRRSRRLSCRW